jgi:cation transport ATPase
VFHLNSKEKAVPDSNSNTGLSKNKSSKDNASENFMSSQLLAEAVMESTKSGSVEFSKTSNSLFASNTFLSKCKNRFLLKSFLVLNYLIYFLFLNYLVKSSSEELIYDYKIFGAAVFLILTLLAVYDEVNLRLQIIVSSYKSRKSDKATLTSQPFLLGIFNKKFPYILEVLVVLAITFITLYTFFLSPYSNLENFNFESLLFLVTVFSFSLYIDVLIYRKANSLSALELDNKLSFINKAHNFSNLSLSSIEKSVKDSTLIKENDLFIVSAGVILPVDTEVVRGSAYVKQFTYENESELVVKAEGSLIKAGSSIVSGNIIVRAISSFFESEISFFLDHVKEIQTNANLRVANQKKQSNLLNWYYTLLTFVLATAAIFWYQNGEDIYFIVNLVASGFCLNYLAKIFTFNDYEEKIIPLAFFKKGLVYLNTEFWISLAKVKKIFIKDQPSNLFNIHKVTEFIVIDERVDFDKFLPIIAKLILMSAEPEVKAFSRYFKLKNIVPDLSGHDDFYLEPGKGIQVNMHGVKIIYGSEEFLLSNNVKIQSSDIDENHVLNEKRFVAIESLPVAYFVFEEVKTSEKLHFINKIKENNISFKILTGLKDKDLKSRTKELDLELKDVKSLGSVNELVELTNKVHRDFSHSIFYPLSKGESYHVDNFSNLAVVGTFDPVEYNLYNFDSTLIKQDLAVIPNSIRLSRNI